MADKMTIYATEAEATKAIKDDKREKVVAIKVATVLGMELDAPLEGFAIAAQFATIEEAKNAGEWPNESQILKGINTRLYNTTRQNGTVTMSAEKREAVQGTKEYKRNELVKSIMASNKALPREQAEAAADSLMSMGV